jgi:lipid-A-disaccharide synthase-like uncharacterized protein
MADLILNIGFVALGLTAFTWFRQFYISWKEKKSTIDSGFWYVSLISTGLMFIHAVEIWDPVFMIAYGAGEFINVYNLYLIKKNEKV